MNKKIMLAALLLMNVFIACKKEKADEPDNKPAEISTLEIDAPRSADVYGSDITFKIKFAGIGKNDKAVDEYGILFKSWIADLADKIPISGTGSIILFHDAPVAGVVIEKEVTLTFEQFNDANYRAFARLKDGTYVYGEVMYFVSN